jgi:phosphatidylglycerol lysyltransferase
VKGSWSVRLAATLTAVMGVLNVTSGVTPSEPERVRQISAWSPLFMRHGGHLAAALAGFALLLLAVNLARRKRAAWFLTEAVLLVSVASHMIKGFDFEEAAVAAGLAVFLFSQRHYFHALSDPPSVRQGLRVMFGALAFTLFYGVAGFYLLDHHFSVNFGLWAALRQTVVMFTQLYDPGLEPVTRFGRWFADSIYGVSVATTGWAFLMIVRPVLLRRPANLAERARALAIVTAHGRSSLAPLALMDDKSYFFSPGGSVIAFVVKARVALALGDPIGPPDDLAAAVAAFLEHCSRRDWRPAFYQVMPDGIERYRAAGFETLCIGHEAIVDLATFSLEGRAMKPLRGAVNRLQRSGARAIVVEPPLEDRLLRELRAVSDEWLDTMHGSEKRFSLGWFDDAYLRSGPVMTVVTPAGGIRAFANLCTEFQRNELTVDLMRYRRDAESGTMDFLLIEQFRWARERGYDTFNLGLSALARVGGERGSPAFERALRFIYEHVNGFYSFKGVHDFKDKFSPRWEPRHLVYPGATSLPAVALALILADSGTSTFWPWRPAAGSDRAGTGRPFEEEPADAAEGIPAGS